MKWTSRKWLASIFSAAFSLIVPILFRKLEIDNGVTMLSMGTVSSLCFAYLHYNTKDRSIEVSNGVFKSNPK